MSKNLKIILSLLGLVVLAAGLLAGVWLVRQSQEIRKKAAVPEGKVVATVLPTSAIAQVGETIPVRITFNTNDVAISAIAVRLNYSFSESTPPMTTDSIQINNDLEDWTCPAKQTSYSGGKYYIDIACVNTNVNGYSNNTDTLLASFSLAVTKVPEINPLVLTFDSQESAATTKAEGEDTLLIPTSSGTYTVSGEGELPCDLEFGVGTLTPTPTGTLTPTPTETPTPTPTGTLTPTPTGTLTPTPTGTITPTPTETPTPTPTSPPGETPTPTPTPTLPPGVTATPTPTLPPGVPPTATPTPVVQVKLPEAGFSLPTIGAVLGGVLLVITSLLIIL